ncbi:hypothetical protein SAMN05519103_09067 [Rhizobiales bacterium GAS113]|nr:hypothetical protein SAMN05519103_09067 [Rhizobiales bacterium GAS113]
MMKVRLLACAVTRTMSPDLCSEKIRASGFTSVMAIDDGPAS